MASNTLPGISDDAAGSALRQNFLSTPVQVSLTTTTARSALLPPGRYRIHTTNGCRIMQGDSTVVALTTDHPLPVDVIDYLMVTSAQDGYVAGIMASGTATLTLSLQRD